MLSQENPKILIVDDIPPNIAILEEELNIDYEIVTATNGKQAAGLALDKASQQGNHGKSPGPCGLFYCPELGKGRGVRDKAE